MHLTFEQRVACDRDRLWRFHNDPDNLARLLARWKAFRMVSHEGRVTPGARLVVAERIGGLEQVLTFVHDLYEPPDPSDPGRPARFGERQVAGPFATYVHVHEFLAEPGGEAGAGPGRGAVAGESEGTRIIDRLDVRLRGRYGGEAITRAVVGPRLRRFFACRHAALERLLSEGAL